MRLGLLGVWSPGLRDRDSARVAEAAAELEELGYGTLWFPAGRDRGFEIGATLLRATRSVTVATGIVSVWNTSAEEARAGFAELERVAPGRFLLGIGISHAPIVNRSAPNRYTRPIETMTTYLGSLDDVPRHASVPDHGGEHREDPRRDRDRPGDRAGAGRRARDRPRPGPDHCPR